MASEIKIPCLMWPHRTTKANAYEYTQATGNNVFQGRGIATDDAKDSLICFLSSVPIPATVNATPNGILRFEWFTSATSGDLKLQVDAWAGAVDTVTLDVSGTGTVTTTGTDTAGTAYVLRKLDIALTALAASLIDGNRVFGTFARNASTDAGDTLSARATFLRVLLMLDT